MEPITATHTLYASPGAQSLHREDDVPENWQELGFTIFVLAGQLISPRAQLMYGLTLAGDEILIGHERDPQYVETEEDHGDIPA